MGIFDRLKKKREIDYDPLNIKVTDLQIGFILDYDDKTWEVKDIYEYDWGNHSFSKEYKLRSASETVYLSVEEDDGYELAIFEKVKLRKINNDLPEIILRDEKPPRELVYSGIIFYYDKESPGYFKPQGADEKEWEEFISWDYYDDSEKHLITIEQWEEDAFEASVGKVIREHEIYNILPRK